jgi:hypothetical protein
MPLVGDIAEFAIEYTLTGVYPPYGHLRLWIGGSPFGDYTEAMHLYHGLSNLKKCTLRNPETDRMVWDSVDELPDPESALEHYYLTLGEAHDNYELAVYPIMREQRFRFYWRIRKQDDSPTHPNHPLHEADVSWNTFDQVVNTVTTAIEAEASKCGDVDFSFD